MNELPEFLQTALDRAYNKSLGGGSRAIFVVTSQERLSLLRGMLTNAATGWGSETRLCVVTPNNAVINFDSSTGTATNVNAEDVFVDPDM